MLPLCNGVQDVILLPTGVAGGVGVPADLDLLGQAVGLREGGAGRGEGAVGVELVVVGGEGGLQ